MCEWTCTLLTSDAEAPGFATAKEKEYRAHFTVCYIPPETPSEK